MSKIEVDAIEPQSGTTLTLGASGDSVNIASGAKITDFTSTGIDDNATSTAITIDSSENVGIGTSSPDENLHIFNGSAGSVTANVASQLVIENSGDAGINILSPNTQDNWLMFGDADDNFVGGLKYNHPSDYLALYANNAERIRILSSGGITFNGDTATANALDDYEEGTWSPAFLGSTSGASGVNFNYRVGTYVKIGNNVTVHIFIALSSWSSGPVGNVSVGTLPFAATSTANYRAGASIGYSANFSQGPGGGIVIAGTTEISLRKWTSTSAQSNITNNLTGSDMSGDEGIIITATYQTD